MGWSYAAKYKETFLIFDSFVFFATIFGDCILFCTQTNVYFVEHFSQIFHIAIVEKTETLPGQNSIFFHAIRNHFADFCWAISFCTAIKVIGIIFELSTIVIYISMISICFLSECIQIFEFIPMTFDIIDVLFQLLGLFCAIALYKMIMKERRTLK